MSRLPNNQLALKINHTKRAILKSKWALSTVVTTLIILVISVLLASVVTYFAINVVSTRVQEESLALTKQHLYHNSTALPASASYAQGTLMVINTGGRDIVIDKLAVRGQECSWHDNSTNKMVLFCVTTDSVSADMPYVYNFNLTGSTPVNEVTFGSTKYSFTLASNDLVLRSGYTMMIYIINPDSITINDIGLTCSITLYTAQAMYYRESNVQAVGDSTSSTTPVSGGNEEPDDNPGYTITNVHAWYDALGSQVAFVVTNNRGIDFQLDFSSFKANGVQIDAAYMDKGVFTVGIDLPYASDIGEPIDGHTLTVCGLSTTIPDGQTAIIYALGCSGITADDVGNAIDITISTSALPATRTVTVEPASTNQ